MFKKIILVSALISQTIIAQAQKTTLTWGQESKNDVTYNSFVRGSSNDLIKLCFEEKGRTITPIMTRYNDKLNEVSSNAISVDQDGVLFDRLLGVKDGLFFFTNIYDKKSKTTSFYCQPLDIKTFNREGVNINLGTFAAFRKKEQASVQYHISGDSTKLLMMGLSPYSKDEAEKYYISVYDYKMSKLWDKTVELPYKDKDISIFGQLITNDGKVAVLIKHYDNETVKQEIKKDGKKIPSYTTKLLVYSKQAENPHEYIINIGNKFVHDLDIANEKNNELTLFGMYKEKSDGFVSGYFITKINSETEKVNTSNINPFPEDLLAQLKRDKQGSDSDNDGGINGKYRFARSVTRENGDEDFLLESYYKVFVSSKYGSYWLYEHGNILDINVKKNGTSIITRIPKLQVSGFNAYCSSFRAMPYKDKLLLFYNDNEDNLKQKITDRPDKVNFGIGGAKILGGTADAYLTMATIDGNGNLNRTVLMDKKQSKYITAINVSLPILKNRLAVYAIKGKKDMIGYLDIE